MQCLLVSNRVVLQCHALRSPNQYTCYWVLLGQLRTVVRSPIIKGCRSGRKLRWNVSQFARQSGRALLCPWPTLLFPSYNLTLSRNIRFASMLVSNLFIFIRVSLLWNDMKSVSFLQLSSFKFAHAGQRSENYNKQHCHTSQRHRNISIVCSTSSTKSRRDAMDRRPNIDGRLQRASLRSVQSLGDHTELSTPRDVSAFAITL